MLRYTSNHRIQVFSKGFRITKKDESFSNTLTGARFKLYRTARDTDPEDQKESLSGLEGEFIEVEDLDTSAEGVAQCDEVRTLLEDEQYYLVETEAPDGYIINHPVLVNLLTENTYRPIPGSNPWQGEKPDTGLYDWHQESALTLGPTGSVKIWTGEELIESATGLLPDGDTYIIEYYISNNPGVELPATGGSGTRLYYLIGLLMMVIAGTGLVIRRNALHGAKSPS